MNARSERILIFGDSLTQHASGANPIWNVDAGPQRPSAGPGDLLASLLLDQGATVRTNALVSRSAVNFWTREAAQDLIAADRAWRPTKVVFVLGTNDVGLNAAADYAAFVRLRDAYKAPGVELWAIGPFTSRLPAAGIEVVAATMRKVFGARFIDGRPLSRLISPGPDGVHYTPTSARLLALNLADALLSASPVRPWMGLAIGAGIVVGGALIYGLATGRARGLAGVEIVDGRRWTGGSNELVRSGYRQIPCKSGLDTKGLARCWSRGLGSADVTLDAATKRLVTRARKLIATLAAGDYEDTNAATALMMKINAATLKLDNTGHQGVAADLQAAKVAALEAGRAARTARLAEAMKRARDEQREAERARPDAWMHRRGLRGSDDGADDDDEPRPGEDDETWWQRLSRQARRGQDRMQAALDQHDALILTARGGRRILVLKTPEMSDPAEGPLRVTTFDEDGPIGHTTRRSLEALAEDVYRDWHPETITPASEAEVLAWTGTERFARGAAAVAEMQRRNRPS